MMKIILSAFFLFLFVPSCSVSQTSTSAWPTPAPVEATGVSIVDGKFVSKPGRLSISIAEMPLKTLDIGTEKARAKGVDAGKQYAWQFEGTIFTVMYTPPVDNDGNELENVFDDMVIGTRKGILRQNLKVASEKPFTAGDYSGTELRYTSAEKVHFINRLFVVNGYGYQVVGGYVDGKEKEVLDVLNSFKVTSTK